MRGFQHDGLHGVIADSMSVSWDQVRQLAGTGPYQASGVRVTAPPDKPTEARDWTIYEFVDRVQLMPQTANFRTLYVKSERLQIGRGRVMATPVGPNLAPLPLSNGVSRIEGPATGSFNTPFRSRATSVRATSLTLACTLTAEGSSGPILMDNYRVAICEGRPSVQHRSDYAFVFPSAELDNPVDAIAGYLTPVPDFATRVEVQLSVQTDISGGQYGIAWISPFGARVPGAAVVAGLAPHVTQGQPWSLPVPWWASMMHLFRIGAVPANAEFAQLSWELEL